MIKEDPTAIAGGGEFTWTPGNGALRGVSLGITAGLWAGVST